MQHQQEEQFNQTLQDGQWWRKTAWVELFAPAQESRPLGDPKLSWRLIGGGALCLDRLKSNGWKLFKMDV